MSHSVSKITQAFARRMLGAIGILMGFAVAASCATPVLAQSAFTAAAGVDIWSVPGQVRYIPNYSTPRAWQSANPWASAKAQTAIDTEIGPLTFAASGQTSPVYGNRIDRLDVDLRMTEHTGIRAGILPYRVSWCRGYEASSPWISEPDAFCRFHGLAEIRQGGFGAQIYHSDMVGGWLVDGMAGIYRPMVDGQDKALGPYVAVGPTVRHEKFGASINALHLASGIQARAGYLHTLQHQDSSTGSYQRRLDYDTIYLAAEGNVTQRLDVRASMSAYVGDQLTPANKYAWDGRTSTIEAIYKPVQGHSLALGLSRYTNTTIYATRPTKPQTLSVPSLSLAWRADLPYGWWMVTQATYSKDDSRTSAGVLTSRAGKACGIRLARAF